MTTTDPTYQPCERSNCKGNLSPPSDSQNSTNADRPIQRIALFTGAYNHVLDGVSLTLNRLVKYLTGKGYEVLVVAPTSPEPAVKDYAGTVIPTVSFSLPFRPGRYISQGLCMHMLTSLSPISFFPAQIKKIKCDAVVELCSRSILVELFQKKKTSAISFVLMQSIGYPLASLR